MPRSFTRLLTCVGRIQWSSQKLKTLKGKYADRSILAYSLLEIASFSSSNNYINLG